MTIRRPSPRQRGRTPLSLRLTAEERRLLEMSAAQRRMSVSAYIRSKLFGPVSIENVDGDTEAPSSPLARDQVLARMLGKLGELQALRNLSDLAEAARIGLLPLTPQVVEEIRAACHAVVAIRDMLVQALGLKPSGSRRP